MLFGTFFTVLTSLAFGGVMTWHVSMCEVGVCSSVVFILIAGEKGPNGGTCTDLWPHPAAMEMW